MVFLGVIIASIGYKLQLRQFGDFPPPNDTYDEYKAPFNGISLLTKGKPISWSWWEDYGKFPVVQVRNNQFRLVEPWFDEPPLFSLAMGGYAISKGITTLEQVDVGVFRYPMAKLGFLNILMLFLIIYLLGKPGTAIVASLIYATTPTMAMAARLPISDNFVATLSLLSALLLVLYRKTKARGWMIAMAIAAAAATLVKSTGLFVPAGIIFVMLAVKDRRAAITTAGTTLAAMAIWLAYGWHYNWDVFWKIFAVSSGRELYRPGNILYLFNIYRIGESVASVDGWLIWGWMGIAAWTFLGKKEQRTNENLILPAMMGAYLVFFSVMSGHAKGWYRDPFYPYLAWAGAELIVALIQNPNFLGSIMFLAVPVASSWIWGTGKYNFSNPQIKMFQYFVLALTAPIMAHEIFRSEKWKIATRAILAAAFIAAIILNFRSIWLFQDAFWYQ